MTKLEKIKEQIGYTKDAPKCSTCEFIGSKLVTVIGMYGSYIEEKNIRCEKHNFVTKKNNYCNDFKRKDK